MRTALLRIPGSWLEWKSLTVDMKGYGTMQRSLLPRNVILVLVALLILQTIYPAPANSAEVERSPEAAIDLMVAARGMLIEDDVDDGEDNAGGGQVFSIRRDVPPNSVADQILVRLINATKKQLGDLEQACNELRGSYDQPGQECEDKLTKAFCDENIAKLRARLSFLRKVRGDRRKGLTRTWHSIKRAGARIWRSVGPLGRRFLRNLGDEAFAIVKSGGSLHGGVLRKLVIKHAKTIVRREGRRILKRTAQRVIVGRAQAGDACQDGQVAAEPQENQIVDCSSEDWYESTLREIENVLVIEGKNCQVTGFILLADCLWEQAFEGVCKEDAIDACQSTYDAIPSNDAGGTLALKGVTMYSDANPNKVEITYPSTGGMVKGTVNLQRYEDVFGCTYTLKGTLTGHYDATTCTIEGTSSLTMIYDGYCVSVCGNSPASPTSCPVTFERSNAWDATLEDGELRGEVGGESCDRGCFSFKAPSQ